MTPMTESQTEKEQLLWQYQYSTAAVSDRRNHRS